MTRAYPMGNLRAALPSRAPSKAFDRLGDPVTYAREAEIHA